MQPSGTATPCGDASVTGMPAMYDVDGRAGKLMDLLVAEIATMPRLSLHAPLPANARLAKVCRRGAKKAG